MNDQKPRQIRAEIGLNIRRARELMPDERRTVTKFAAELGIGDSLLSQMESGTRPVSADLLLRIAELTSTSPEILLGVREHKAAESDGFAKAIEFLQKAEHMGVEGFEVNRDLALYHFVPFITAMYSGEVNITASSLKGLQQDSNNEFVLTVASLSRKRPLVNVRIMFTHPADGYRREVLEGRVKGSIVTEIWQGIRWAIEIMRVQPHNIKLVKASPNIFSIFAWNGKNGIALINPYPLMKQAFVSFSMLIRSGDSSATRKPGQSSPSPIFESLLLANFRGPWGDNTTDITVDLDRGISECLDSNDEQLRREGKAMRDFLDKQRSNTNTNGEHVPKGGSATDNSIGKSSSVPHRRQAKTPDNAL